MLTNIRPIDPKNRITYFQAFLKELLHNLVNLLQNLSKRVKEWEVENKDTIKDTNKKDNIYS